MSVLLKDNSNTLVYTFPSGMELTEEPWNKRLDTEPRAYQAGGIIVSDEKVATRMVFLHGIFKKDSQALMETELNSMKKACYTEDLRLYATQNSDDFYNVECLNFEHIFLGMLTAVEINIDFQCANPFRYYKDETTDTSYLSKCLSLNGSGYISIADGSQKGLDGGISDLMLGIWIKTSSTAIFPIFYKGGAGGYYNLHLNASTGYLECKINDGTNTATITGDIALNDDEWHLVRVSIDKSSATGGRLYADGAEDMSAQTDVTSVLDIDNDGVFYVGYDGSNFATGKFDEPEVWNFGYGGLPGDVAAYDTWRYANPYAALTEYDSGAWDCYDDADRSEWSAAWYSAIDPGIENWTGDTPDNWLESNESAGVRDILDEQVQIHGGSHAAKFLATGNDGTDFFVRAFPILVANKYYEITAWVYFSAKTTGEVEFQIRNDTDGNVAQKTLVSTNAAYTQYGAVGKPTVANNEVWLRYYSENPAGTCYWDDISVKQVGLVAHWKLGNNYTDETTNSNDLSAGGSGNSFVLASLPDSTITNDGDIEVHPVITFTAGTGTSITAVQITNSTDSGKNFTYTPALPLTSGHIVEIDCQEGTVKLNTGAGLADDIAHFGDTSEFIKLVSGSNTIAVTITGTAGYSTLVFTFRKKYL